MDIHQDSEADKQEVPWCLRLYVTGKSPKCLRAIENLELICEEHAPGRDGIEFIDVLANLKITTSDF